jgi:branched-chain amino acid transport system ATP-binding protein
LAILSIRGVVAGYGLGDILHGVDLDVEQGTITCVIGPNGAGKSTVLKVLSGLLRPREGEVRLGEEVISGRSPREILDRGIVHVPQERSLFPSMSVWDNILMGGYVLPRSALRRRIEEVAERFPIVVDRRHAHAGSLSGGEQKIAEIARAMMLDPKIVLMDEPSMGLDPKGRKVVFEAVRGLKAAGKTVLLVEQNARSGLEIATRGAVMETGAVRLEGEATALLDDPEVARLYLGGAARTDRETLSRPGTNRDAEGASPDPP